MVDNEFNALEGLENYDAQISKVYCGPGSVYKAGAHFNLLPLEKRLKFEGKSNFRIGEYVTTKIRVGEVNPKTKTTKMRPIGKAEIIDIILDNKNEWYLRLHYSACSSYNGNCWPHYSDVKLEKCEQLS